MKTLLTYLFLTLGLVARAQTVMPLPFPVVQSNTVTSITINNVRFPSKLTDPNGPVLINAEWRVDKDTRIGESSARGEVRYDFNIVIPQSNIVAQIQANTVTPPTGPITNVLQALDVEATSTEGAAVMLGLEVGTALVEDMQGQ